MPLDPISVIEYEAMILGRHLSGLPGRRTRRRGGVLDQSAYTLLSILDAGGNATISDLGRVTGLEVSTLNRQTAALIRDGYATRVQDPAGGMARRFQLSRTGRDVLDEERAASHAALADIVGEWDEKDLEALGRLMERLNKAVESHTDRHWPRPDLDRVS